MNNKDLLRLLLWEANKNRISGDADPVLDTLVSRLVNESPAPLSEEVTA